jgi:uncharacterized protein Usg
LNVFFFGELRIVQMGWRLACAVSKDFNFPALRGFLAFWQERLEGLLGRRRALQTDQAS